MYKEKRPEAERDARAAEVEAQAKQQLEHQVVTLLVEDVRVNKGFITLLVKEIEIADAK